MCRKSSKLRGRQLKQNYACKQTKKEPMQCIPCSISVYRQVGCFKCEAHENKLNSVCMHTTQTVHTNKTRTTQAMYFRSISEASDLFCVRSSQKQIKLCMHTTYIREN